MKKQPELTTIREGDKIIVDKGFTSEWGVFKSVTGFSMGGLYGIYEGEDGGERIWDQTVHKISKVGDKK